MEIRRNARGVVYDADRGVYLLLLKDKGEWELPGGRIEPGEPPEEAVRRELYEESRLKGQVIPGRQFVVEFDTTKDGRPIHVPLVVYPVIADSTQPVTVGEGHKDYAWTSRSKAAQLIRFPEQRAAFLHLTSY